MKTHTRFIVILLPHTYGNLAETWKADKFVFSFSQSTSPAKAMRKLRSEFSSEKACDKFKQCFQNWNGKQ